MAAGITIERSGLGALRAFFEAQAASEVFRLHDEESLEIDAALSAEGATLALVDALDAAGPYGAGHPPPLLALPRHKLVDARAVGTGHIRVDLQSASGGRIQAMAFRAVDTALGDFLFKNRGATIHVAGSLSANYWNGNRTAQFRLIDAAAGLIPKVRPKLRPAARLQASSDLGLGRLVAHAGSPRRRDGIRTGRYGRASAAATCPADRRQAGRAKCGPG